MSKVVIAGAKRTALGALLGQFTGVPATQLGSTAIKANISSSLDLRREPNTRSRDSRHMVRNCTTTNTSKASTTTALRPSSKG